MKRLNSAFAFCLVLTSLAITNSFAQTANEKAVRAYYAGFETHDWNTVVAQLAEGFTFTSPNNDDHIQVDQFKAKCFPTNQFFRKVNFIKVSESGNSLFLLVEILTTDNKVVRNVDFYTFANGKIKSIECFFGPGAWFPGNKK